MVSKEQITPLPVHLEKRLNIRKARWLAPFFRRYRDRLDYSRLPERIRIAYDHGLLTDDGKLFYVKNSKAGCTSIAQLLYKYSKGDFYRTDIHNAKVPIRQYATYWRDYESALASGDTIAFTFVRHPRSRLLSAFRDFLVEKKNASHSIHLPALESRGFKESNPTDVNLGIFLDYVEESTAIDPLYTDRHWRSQCVNIAEDDIDYAIKLENFKSDIKRVFATIGRDDFLEEEEAGVKFNSSREDRFTIAPAQEIQIERIYKEDFEKFGY
jgi:hypothetical protein